MEIEEAIDSQESDPQDILDTGKWLPTFNKLSCEICDQKFCNKLKIVLHWCTSHGYKLCSFCTNYAFKYDTDRIQHERQHLPFGCSTCDYEFTSISETNISEHYKQSHQSFLCSFCSSVIQPYSKYSEHAEKKHSVVNYMEFIKHNRLFELDSPSEINRNSVFKCNMCNKSKRIDLLFGHYVFYHSISMHSLKKYLDLMPEIVINGSVLGADDSESSTDMEDIGCSSNSNKCSVCETPFRIDEKSKEFHNVFCQGYAVCSLKDCIKIFESEKDLNQHLHTDHSTINCQYGCTDATALNPAEVNDHMQNIHEIVECFLCNVVNSIGNLKNHLREKHAVNLMTYEKALSSSAVTSKLYRVESTETSDSKQVLCNFCDHDITDEIKEFSFVGHYRNQHEIGMMEILRNLNKNPIIDDILEDKRSRKCLENFSIIQSFNKLIDLDFDTSQVWFFGAEHIEEKPIIDNGTLKSAITCELCVKTFTDTCSYYEHLKQYHGFKFIYIDSCDKCKDVSCDSQSSEDNKNLNLFMICPLDSTYHVSKDSFKHHMVYEHMDSRYKSESFYKCLVCSFAYKSLKDIRKHFNTFHPDVKMKYCKLCRYKLTGNENLDHFMINHADDIQGSKKFCCNLCQKVFKKIEAAQHHYANKHVKKEIKKKSIFKCQFTHCSKIFESMEDRKMHTIFEHPDEKLYQCKSCPLKFNTKSSLSSHNVIHRNVVNTCEFCNKTFLRRDSFKEHLLIHSDVRLKCSFCEKVFVQRSNLVRHERIHLNEKPYACSFCEKTFSDKGACSSHEKVHTKEESSNCEVCGKHFARKQKLKYHMRLHTLQNVLTCECGKIFSESYSFRKHQENHERQKRCFKCKYCGIMLRSTKSREKHEKAEHGSEEESSECEVKMEHSDKDEKPEIIVKTEMETSEGPQLLS